MIEEWCAGQEIEWSYIQPGKPTQNSLIERFNRTFRQEVLDGYMFDNLKQIKEYAQAWMWMYNNERPHSALGYLTPVEFLLKYGKLLAHNGQPQYPTFQQDNNSDWKLLTLNVVG